TGEFDTFYLEGAVRRFADTLTRLGADAEVFVVPGKNHSDLLSKDLRHKIMRQMSAVFLAAHGRVERPAGNATPAKKVGTRRTRVPATTRYFGPFLTRRLPMRLTPMSNIRRAAANGS